MFPLFNFSQVQQGTVVKQVTPVNVTNKTVNERPKEYSNPDIEILQSIEVDLNNYTDILLVSVNVNDGYRSGYYDRYDGIKRKLVSSRFNIQHPKEVDKKKWKKNSSFLKEVKNPKYLYLYIDFSKIMDDVITILTIKDFENNIIYSTKNTNISTSEILLPLCNF